MQHIKIAKLDKFIELNSLEKQNRRNRLEDKLRQRELSGDIEDLFDSLPKTFIQIVKHGKPMLKKMQTLQNKTLASLDSKTNALKILGNHQQSSFLDERAALLTPTPDPPVTLKDDRGETFGVDNDMIDILLEMGKQTNKQFQLISVDKNSNNLK